MEGRHRKGRKKFYFFYLDDNLRRHVKEKQKNVYLEVKEMEWIKMNPMPPKLNGLESKRIVQLPLFPLQTWFYKSFYFLFFPIVSPFPLFFSPKRRGKSRGKLIKEKKILKYLSCSMLTKYIDGRYGCSTNQATY